MTPQVLRVALIALSAATVPAAFLLAREGDWTARAVLLVLAGLALAWLAVFAPRLYRFARLLVRFSRAAGRRLSTLEPGEDEATPTDAQRWMLRHRRGVEITADLAIAVGAIAIVVLGILLLPLN